MASINSRPLSILPVWLQTTALAGLLAAAVELPRGAPTWSPASHRALESMASSHPQHERALMIEVSLPILEAR